MFKKLLDLLRRPSLEEQRRRVKQYALREHLSSKRALATYVGVAILLGYTEATESFLVELFQEQLRLQLGIKE